MPHARISRWRYIFFALLLVAGEATQADEATGRDRYGGDTSIQCEATGHFYTKQLGHRWVFITPEGHPYLSVGINHLGNCITPGKCWSAASRFYVESGGNKQAAIESILEVAKNLNFNSGGGYAPMPAGVKKSLPYVSTIGYPDGKKFEFDVFDPVTERKLRDRVRQAIRSDKDNPFLMGYYYIDCPQWNERLVEFYRTLPENSPGGKKYRGLLKQHEAEPGSPLPQKLQEEFMAIVAERLYSIMHAAIRETDPHHLIFGEKFVTRRVPHPVLKAITPFIDVFSVQPLGGVAKQDCVRFQRKLMDEYYRICGKPVMVPDYACTFFTPATKKTHWHQLKTEQDASRAYRDFLSGAFRTPYIVGVHRCELQTWYKPAQRHWRQGILDPSGQPYPLLAETVTRTNRDVIETAYEELKK